MSTYSSLHFYSLMLILVLSQLTVLTYKIAKYVHLIKPNVTNASLISC
jgi:hypothetical protein